MADRRIHVLGPIHVTVDGTPIRLAGRLTRALLTRLVVAQGRAVSADRLVDELWDGDPPVKATSVLQVHIHNLRRVFEPERPARAPARVVVSEGLGYALRLRDDEVDAWQFEALLREYLQRYGDPHPPDPQARTRMLDTALACWQGRALESFEDAGWAAAEAARLTDLLLTAGELRAEAALELGHTTEVIGGLRRTVEDHPEREESVRLLALAQYRLGQQTEALATLRRTREFLAQEMGLDPGHRIQELEAAILNQSVSIAEPATERAGIVRHISGVQRDSVGASAIGYPVQRKMILEAALDAAEHGARVVWVDGAAGIGKTTLTTAIAAELREREWVLAHGRCPEVDGAPRAWAWAEVATSFGDEAAPPVTDGPFAISQLVAHRCLRAVAAGPVVLILEDLHRADDATLQILRQTVAWLHDQPVLVVATLRHDEAPGSLHATIAALADTTAAHIELDGVDLDGAQAIAREAGLTGLDSATLELLHERTGGNPLFLKELSALVADGGDVHELPPGTRGILEQRLRRRSGSVRELLEWAAVCGERVESDTLAAVSGRLAAAVADPLAASADAGLVHLDATGRIVFSHALIRDTVYAGIPQWRRARMHQRVLEVLSESARIPSDARGLQTLAHHAVHGATIATAAAAAEHVAAAARHCAQRGMRADAAPLWRTVIELRRLAGHDQRVAADADRRAFVEAHCELVTASAFAGQLDQARHAREQALQLAQELGHEELVVDALTSWRAPVVWGIRDWRWTDPNLRRALATVSARGQPVATQVRLLTAAVFESGPAAHRLSHTRAREAWRLAQSTGDPELHCVALNTLADLALAQLPDGHSGAELGRWSTELMRISTAAKLPEYRAVAHYLKFRIACCEVDLVEARRQAGLAIEFASTGQVRTLVTVLGYFGAATDLLRGDIGRAGRRYAEFTSRAIEFGFPNTQEAQLVGRLLLGWVRRDLSDSVQPLARVHTELPGMLTQVYIVALLDAGDRERAAALFDTGPGVDEHFYPTIMRAYRARAALALGDIDECEELYRVLLPAAGAIAGFETGFTPLDPVDDILADLAAACGDENAARRHRAAARALWERVRADLARHPQL